MTTTQHLVRTIIKGIQEKKGQDITVIDLSGIDGAIARYFVICQGNSPTQVEAIAESIGDAARIDDGEKPLTVIGLTAAQWVAMDYSDVLVHVFIPEARKFYDLENLWQDAKLTTIPNAD